MDFRLNRPEVITSIKQRIGLDDHDLIAFPGFIRDLASHPNPDIRQYLFEKISLGPSLHQVKRFVLIGHTDCGAYGGQEAFSSPQMEKDVITSDLRTARIILIETFPDISIDLYLACIDGHNQVKFESVS